MAVPGPPDTVRVAKIRAYLRDCEAEKEEPRKPEGASCALPDIAPGASGQG